MKILQNNNVEMVKNTFKIPQKNQHSAKSKQSIKQ